MPPVFFPDPESFHQWLAENHTTATEITVGFYKKHTGQPSMDWPQSVKVALCFGWIDGIRRGAGEEAYTIRFTPRKPKSIWSNTNINYMEALIAEGKVLPAGLAAYEKREAHRSGIYAYETDPKELSAEYQAVLQEHPEAWAYFQAQTPYQRKRLAHWVMSAKQETTRLKRLQTLIEDPTSKR